MQHTLSDTYTQIRSPRSVSVIRASFHKPVLWDTGHGFQNKCMEKAASTWTREILVLFAAVHKVPFAWKSVVSVNDAEKLFLHKTEGSECNIIKSIYDAS